MSNSIPARRPAWVDTDQPIQAEFSYTVLPVVENWLVGKAIFPFFNSDIKIIGSLNNNDERYGHYLLEVDNLKWVAHVKPVSGKQDLIYAEKIASYLGSFDIPITAFKKTSCNNVESSCDSCFITVTQFHKGKHTENTLSEAKSLGGYLANIHKLLKVFPESEKIKHRTNEVIESLINTQDSIRNSFPDYISPARAELVLKAVHEYDPFFKMGGQSQCIHGDLSPGNVLFCVNNEIILCDFEDSAFSYRPPVFDIGMALLRFALEGDDGIDGSTPLERANAFLAEYEINEGTLPSTSNLIKGIKNIAYHSCIMMAHLAIKHDIWYESEWDKPVRWLEISEYLK
jgi:serine/threonine protein kinase